MCPSAFLYTFPSLIGVFVLFLIISLFPAGWESFLTLISELFLTSSCFYLWISTSNPKLLPPGPQINEAASLPALILCILSAELHCCFEAGIEGGGGSVALTALTERRRNSPGVFPAISSSYSVSFHYSSSCSFFRQIQSFIKACSFLSSFTHQRAVTCLTFFRICAVLHDC